VRKDEEHEERGDDAEDGVERVRGIDCHCAWIKLTPNNGVTAIYMDCLVGVSGSQNAPYYWRSDR
jgi:hypothetical protein